MSGSGNTTCSFLAICLKTFYGNSQIISSVTVSSVISLLFSFCAVLGNALVLTAYYFYWSSHLTRPSNIFILGLALTDFVIGLVSGPACITRSLLTLSCHPSICVARKLEKTFIVFYAGASLIILSLVSADRYMAIFKSLRYPTLVTNTRAFTAVVSTMIIWITYCAISFAGLTSTKNHSIFGSIKNIIFIVFILGAYLLIYREVRRVKRNQVHLAPVNTTQRQTTRNIREHKATRTMGYITGCVIVTWLPSVVYGISKKAIVASGSAVVDEVLWHVVTTCFLVGAVVNPVLYHWRNEELKLSMERVLNRLFPCLRQNVVVPFIVPTAFVISATPRTKSPVASPRIF